MKEQEQLGFVSGFYYAFIVAIKIKTKSYPHPSESEMKKFIVAWLKTSKEKKIFNPVLKDDIAWLLQDIRKHSVQQYQQRLLKIYRCATNMLTLCESPELA